MNEQARTLLVLWQHQQSRQHVPVSRLTITATPEGQMFELAYLRGYRRAKQLGFSPFVAFPQVHRVYRSSALFGFFRNRVLQRSRPDYADHVRTLGLATPYDMVDVLGRSEGRRETDHVEVVPAPSHDLGSDTYDVHFWARGIRHVPDAETAISTLVPGDLLELKPDLQNKVNPKALLLCTRTRRSIGYLPDYLVDDAHDLSNRPEIALRVRVERVNPPPTPPQRRALCRLQVPWPAGFVSLCGDELRPLEPADTSVALHDNAPSGHSPPATILA